MKRLVSTARVRQFSKRNLDAKKLKKDIECLVSCYKCEVVVQCTMRYFLMFTCFVNQAWASYNLLTSLDLFCDLSQPSNPFGSAFLI